MAQSPGEHQLGLQSNTYFQGWQAVSQLLYEGASWSGNERHCCFLNTHQDRFADVSAASGFDLLDDGRGMGLVDWDHDGDLDVWITNRNGPRIRFLRNDLKKSGHFLAIKLAGTTCNRDAIGARLELHLAGRDQRPLIRTLRAGEGFLGQSSKWVHFGLGEAERIEKLVVHWPGGDPEVFKSLDLDARYTITQGSGRLPWTRPVHPVNFSAKPIQLPTGSSPTRIVLSNRQSMPDLQYTDFTGNMHRLTEHQGRPFLLNVWASWCMPCVQELTEFARERDRLTVAELEIVALNFDGIGNADAGDPLEARRLLQKIDSPFLGGQGSPLVARTLEAGLQFYFDKAGALPLPSSFLVDSSFRVAVIYLGPVSVEQLLADRSILTAPPAVWKTAALPFAGRWSDAPLEEPSMVADLSLGEVAPPLLQPSFGRTALSLTPVILACCAIALAIAVFWWRSRSSATDT